MLTALGKSSDGTATRLDTVKAITAASAEDGLEIRVDLEAPTDTEVKQIGGLLATTVGITGGLLVYLRKRKWL